MEEDEDLAVYDKVTGFLKSITIFIGSGTLYTIQ